MNSKTCTQMNSIVTLITTRKAYKDQLSFTRSPLRVTSIYLNFSSQYPLRKWSSLKETHNCYTNSPSQYLRKCIEKSMENMHTDDRMQKGSRGSGNLAFCQVGMKFHSLGLTHVWNLWSKDGGCTSSNIIIIWLFFSCFCSFLQVLTKCFPSCYLHIVPSGDRTGK